MKNALEMSVILSIRIVNRYGVDICMINMNNFNIHSQDFAKQKADSATSKKIPSSTYNILFQLKGGIPIIEKDISNEEMYIGAIGVSGGTQEQDVEIVLFALEKLGYVVLQAWRNLLDKNS